jgi:succinate dehydrogenase / fumarate reductase cytochrome b subunit
VFLVIWLVAAAAGPRSYEIAQTCAGSWLGYLFLFVYSLCLFFHLLNGIRHLFWDMGAGFELETVTRTGWAVVIGTVLLTVVAWVLGLTVTGGL